MSESYAEVCRRILADLTSTDAPFVMVEQISERGGQRLYGRAPDNVSYIYQDTEAAFANRLLVSESSKPMSLGEALSAARRLAALLQDHYGVQAGNRVGLASRNRPKWFVPFFAITHIGDMAVLFNGSAPTKEFGHTAADKDCNVIIAHTRRAGILRTAGTDAPIVTIADSDNEDVEVDFASLRASADREAQPLRVDPVHLRCHRSSENGGAEPAQRLPNGL